MSKRILVVNPIGTDQWDLSDKEYLSKHAARDTLVDVTSLACGPLSVETFRDELIAAAGVVDVIRQSDGYYDAFVVNCFADPGVAAAREVVEVPVVGAGEASIALAAMLGHKFGIVAINKKYEALFEQKVACLGLERRFAGSIGINIRLNEFLTRRDITRKAISEAARRLIDEMDADVVVLGCTGMLSFAEEIRYELAVPVVEPAVTALKTAELLIDLRLAHSKKSLYSGIV